MAVQGKKVYLSESVFVAFLDRAHEKYRQAGAYFLYFAQERYRLYTDFLSINEAQRTIHFQISPSLARDFLRTIFLSDINIIYPEEAEIKTALKSLLAYPHFDLTFEKALCATLAERRGISQIATVEYLHPLFGQTPFYLPI